MTYYRTCPRCGAHLDPGEACDCLEAEARALIEHVTMGSKSQALGNLDEKTAAGAGDTNDGKETPQDH